MIVKILTMLVLQRCVHTKKNIVLKLLGQGCLCEPQTLLARYQSKFAPKFERTRKFASLARVESPVYRTNHVTRFRAFPRIHKICDFASTLYEHAPHLWLLLWTHGCNYLNRHDSWDAFNFCHWNSLCIFLPRIALLTMRLPSSQGDTAGCFDTSVRFHLPVVACSNNCHYGNSD